jgi:hypothetical protein
MKRFLGLLLIIMMVASLRGYVLAGGNEYVYTVSTDRNSVVIGDGMISIAGGQMIDTPGAPSIGYRMIKLALPPGTQITSLTFETPDPHLLGWANVDFVRGDVRTGNYPADTTAAPDPEIYYSDEVFPADRAKLLGDGNWGDIHVADLAVYPIGYRPQSGSILFYPEITVRIGLAAKPAGGQPDVRPDVHAYRELSRTVSNQDDLALMASPPSDDPPLITNLPSPEYLIITSAQVAPGFYPFLLWKNQIGIPTDMVLIEDILSSTAGGDPAEQLRNYLMEAYNEGVRYILLGGHPDIVPIRYLYPGNVTNYVPDLGVQQISDLYFADLTGEWDADGDGVWGESYHDQPDIYPELYVGRVPASTAEQASVWSHKVILHEKNPGDGDPSYLTKALIISADQMRDLGQQDVLADMMPGNFTVDATRLIEQPSGNDPSPISPTAAHVIEVMQEGWGFISNLNHGDYSWYSAKGAYYNSYGWSGVWGDTVVWNGCGALSHLTTFDQPAIQYSISCDLAALDFDTGIFRPPPYISPYCFAESYLFEPGAGVAFLGNTRWGWVSSSYNLERRFLIHVLNDSTSVLSVAEALSKIDCPNYRDIGYGHNLFGDPSMSIWLSVDGHLSLEGPTELEVGQPQQVQYTVFNGPDRIAGATVCLYKPGEIFEVATTNSAGHASFNIEPQNDGYLTITATMPRYIPSQITAIIGTPAGIDDEPELPEKPVVYQNYPNPFNPRTTIEFYLPARGRADIAIFDIGGRLVRELASGQFAAGSNRVFWDSKDNSGQAVSSGIYFYKFSSGSTVSVKQMTVVK